MEVFLRPESWIALLTLTFLEIVLGIDNIIFISIVTNKLPAARQRLVRNTGLLLAMLFRSLLLLTISFFIRLTNPLFTVFNLGISIRDLILMAGGLFLIIKSISEIHQKMEGEDHSLNLSAASSIAAVLVQIVMLDLIFSFDSILTAIGLTDEVPLMITAIIISIGIMMIFAGAIGRFINKHPTLQVLALSFLILIGFMLIIDGLHYHVPKGYIYFAVFFSLIVEMINMRVRKNTNPVQLHKDHKNT
ncbi:MAG TPA: TerC family protein [Bacteroidales bacterium]|nr:TerC family protein [Bacteroidales bacterium]